MDLKVGDKVYSIKNGSKVTYIITNIYGSKCEVITDDEDKFKYGNVDLRLLRLLRYNKN